MYYDTFHRGLTFTLSGVYTLCLILFVGLIAITTGINGLYVFLSCGLGGFVISGVLSERAIRNIHVGSIGALHLNADEPCTIFFTIENKSPSFTIFGIETLFFTATPRYRLIAGARQHLARHRLTVLGPKSSMVLPALCQGFERGHYDQLKVMNLTTFPLGILEKYKITTIPSHIIVAPKVDEGWRKILEKILPLALRTLDMGPEFFMHLPYRHENPHLLDWRKNAGKRSPNWVVKDLRSDNKKPPVIVDVVWAHTRAIQSKSAYEAYLSRIITAVQTSRQLGLDVILRLDHQMYIHLPDKILLFLASAPQFEQRLAVNFFADAKLFMSSNKPSTELKNFVTLTITESGIDGPTPSTSG